MIKLKIENIEYSGVSKEEVCDVFNKMYTIIDNVESMPEIPDYIDNDITLLVDLCDYLDEFQITSYEEEPICFEVVTEDVATENDMDFDSTRDNLDSYILGEEHSMYLKLGNSKYYYRNM